MYLETEGIVEVPVEQTVAEWGTFFHTNPHHGKTHREMTREMLEVAGETRKRRLHGNDTDDQWWRAHYLREARAQLN